MLVASSSLGMLGFHVSFCECIAGSHSARGISKWRFRSLIINQEVKFVVFLVSHLVKAEWWLSVSHVLQNFVLKCVPAISLAAHSPAPIHFGSEETKLLTPS